MGKLRTMDAVEMSIIKWWTKGQRTEENEQILHFWSLYFNWPIKAPLLHWKIINTTLSLFRIWATNIEPLLKFELVSICNTWLSLAILLERHSALAFPLWFVVQVVPHYQRPFTPEWRNFYVSHTGMGNKINTELNNASDRRFMATSSSARPPWSVCKSI